MHVGFCLDWLKCMFIVFGPRDVSRVAGGHSKTAKRFNSFFDSRHAEAVGAMAEDWSAGLSVILPNFQMADRILSKAERDNTEVVLIVPAWRIGRRRAGRRRAGRQRAGRRRVGRRRAGRQRAGRRRAGRGRRAGQQLQSGPVAGDGAPRREVSRKVVAFQRFLERAAEIPLWAPNL